MRDLVIDRSRRLRGDIFSGEGSYLLDEQGRQCCLGFFLSSCRVPKDRLLDECLPSGIGWWPKYATFEHDIPKSAMWLVEEVGKEGQRVESFFTSVNDDSSFLEPERERRIKALFAEYGVRVKFVGRTPRHRTP